MRNRSASARRRLWCASRLGAAATFDTFTTPDTTEPPRSGAKEGATGGD